MITAMTLTDRLKGVLRLDPEAYEDIEHDSRASRQALTIVVLASVAASLGEGASLDVRSLTRASIHAVTGWVMWANVSYFLGARAWPESDTRTDLDELLRVTGFSYAPNFFSIFAAFPRLFGMSPIVGDVIRGGAQLWLLAATVVAVRQALDYQSTSRAFKVVFVGWLIFLFIGWV
jgi:hypothetical protein